MKQRIYINNITKILGELSDISYQHRVWHRIDSSTGDMTLSFDEAVNMLFGDCIIDDLLEADEVIISHEVTEAFKALSEAVDVIDEYLPQEAIINHPAMQTVREKAAHILALIRANDGSESTVEIVAGLVLPNM
jgi:hypothetical protein